MSDEEEVVELQQYIGAKIIHAEPGKALKQMGDYPEGTDGYRVVYEDGYESWSPTNVLEASYMPTSAMSFGLAIEAMMKGHKVTRGGYTEVIVLKFEDGHFFASSTHGPFLSWGPDASDMTAMDWMIVE
jgi:hypothetical protein